MSRLQTVTFITEAGGTQTLTLQNFTQSNQLEYFTSNYDEAIDGSLRQNLRGKRVSIELSYELCTEPDTYRDICNNIVDDLTNGLEFVYFGIDTDNLIRVVLDEELIYKAEYANQHGLFIPRLTLKASDINAQVNLVVEDWRFITESVTEARDYGLITDSVVTQIDYGLITD